jgi:MFS family permease
VYTLVLPLNTLFTRYPHERRFLQGAGVLVAGLGMVLMAFASKPWHLLIFNGLLYPASVLYYIAAAVGVFEWFQARRGLAGSVLYAGSGCFCAYLSTNLIVSTGAGGVIYPLLLNALIQRFGYRAALVSLGVGFSIIGLATLPFMKNRIPLPPRRSAAMRQRRYVSAAFLKRTPFYAFGGCILLTSLGNFVPPLFIPCRWTLRAAGLISSLAAYAQDLGYSGSQGTMLVAVMNGECGPCSIRVTDRKTAASIPGLLLFGYISDRFSIRILVAVSCICSAFACFLAWGLATKISSNISPLGQTKTEF